MLEETELKKRGWATEQTSIDDAKKELAALHGAKIDEIGHCIDGKTHSELGRNKRFIAMNEQTTHGMVTHLVRQTRGGNTEIVPYKYLASLLHRRTPSGEERYVHFYLKRY